MWYVITPQVVAWARRRADSEQQVHRNLVLWLCGGEVKVVQQIYTCMYDDEREGGGTLLYRPPAVPRTPVADHGGLVG